MFFVNSSQSRHHKRNRYEYKESFRVHPQQPVVQVRFLSSNKVVVTDCVASQAACEYEHTLMSIFGDVIFGTGQQQKIMPLRRRLFPFVASFPRCGPTSSKAGEYAVVLTPTPSARRASHDRDGKSDISR
jgi:hypothetical protein